MFWIGWDEQFLIRIPPAPPKYFKGVVKPNNTRGLRVCGKAKNRSLPQTYHKPRMIEKDAPQETIGIPGRFLLLDSNVYGGDIIDVYVIFPSELTLTAEMRCNNA